MCFFECYVIEIVVMLEKTRGIVLHSLRYNDDSMIVEVLTEERGTVSFLVRVTHSKKSNVKAQLLRPLTILELDIDYRQQRSLQRIRDMRVCVHYISIPYEPLKECVALFLGEFLYYALRNEDRNERLFLFLLHSLDWFDAASENYANFHLALLIKLTRYLGFWPNCEGRREYDFFDLQESSFTAFRPVHGQCLNAEESEWVPRFLKMNYSTMRFFKMSRQQRSYVLDVLCHYYRMHIPEFPSLKSLDVLRTILD